MMILSSGASAVPGPRRQGRRPMHRHGPSCLEGPVSRRRGLWQEPQSAVTPSPEPNSGNPRGKEIRRPDAPIRRELVERIRREIEAGIYDTPEKMEKALERLLEQLDRD